MTPPQTIITARKQLRRSSEPIAGMVMTEVDLKRTPVMAMAIRDIITTPRIANNADLEGSMP